MNCPDEDRRPTGKAFEPFRPSCTMDDVLKREEEIREASLAAYKEKARQSRKRLRTFEGKESNEWKRINSGCYELDITINDC